MLTQKYTQINTVAIQCIALYGITMGHLTWIAFLCPTLSISRTKQNKNGSEIDKVHISNVYIDL